MRLAPVPARRQGRPVERQNRHPDRRKDDTGQGPVLADMAHEPRAPDAQQGHDAPGTPTHDHEERRRQLGPRSAQPVPNRGIHRGHPAWIVRAVGPEHRAKTNGQAHKREPDQLLAAPFDDLRHVAVQKRVPPACLICHALPRPRHLMRAPCRGRWPLRRSVDRDSLMSPWPNPRIQTGKHGPDGSRTARETSRYCLGLRDHCRPV